MKSPMFLGFFCFFVLFIIWLVCFINILIHAFKNELWKGLVGLFIPLYLIYYAFAEYESDNKALVVAGFVIGMVVTTGISIYSAMNAVQNM